MKKNTTGGNFPLLYCLKLYLYHVCLLPSTITSHNDRTLMYNLLLTKYERAAIDWIGNMYNHGDNLRGLLTECEMVADDIESEDIEWLGDYDIKFSVPEHVAWAINEIIDNGNLECFAYPLVTKLLDFANSVV